MPSEPFDERVRLAEDPLHTYESPQPYNTGILVSGCLPPVDSPRTLVVAGTPRGGTTAIAECLATLGVPMGVPVPCPVDRYNYEDPAFSQILHMETPRAFDLDALRGLIAQRNEEHAAWGFKLPMALHSLAVLERELRAPLFVLAFRDAAAIASREVIATGIGAITAMIRALDWQRKILDFVRSCASPCILVSYEKALQFPDILVRVLADWSGLPSTDSALEAARARIVANNDDYLRGVRFQCDQFNVPVPAKAQSLQVPGKSGSLEVR